MESASGRATFGWLLGAGEARGIALAFVAASLLMLVVVLMAFLSAAYRRLNVSYGAASAELAELVPA
jgi:DHA3 family multidrug efflux protein-like MFS transporter